MKKVVKMNSHIVSRLVQVGLNSLGVSYILDKNLVLYVENNQYNEVLDLIRNFPFTVTCAPCLSWYLDDEKEIPFTKMPILKAEIGEQLLQDAMSGSSLKKSKNTTSTNVGVQNQLLTDLAIWFKKETRGTFSSFSLDFPVTFEAEGNMLTVYYENILLQDSFSKFYQKILRKKNHGKMPYGEDFAQVVEILSIFFEECKLDLKNIQYFDSYGNITSQKGTVYQK